MKRVAIVALVAILAACGSDNNGPTDKFSGTWTGKYIVSSTDTANFVLVAGQNGTAVTGTGQISAGTESVPLTFSGTSTPPAVNLTVIVGSNMLTYAGSYVSSDSISGIISEGSQSGVLDLAKH